MADFQPACIRLKWANHRLGTGGAIAGSSKRGAGRLARPDVFRDSLRITFCRIWWIFSGKPRPAADSANYRNRARNHSAGFIQEACLSWGERRNWFPCQDLWSNVGTVAVLL